VVLGREVVVSLDDLVEVGFHELEDDVDVAELAARGREHDVPDLDDVRVAQEAEQLDLPEDAGGVGDVLEDVVDLLDGDALAGVGVDGGGYQAVAALADHLGDLVPARLAVVCEERRLLGALVRPRRRGRAHQIHAPGIRVGVNRSTHSRLRGGFRCRPAPSSRPWGRAPRPRAGPATQCHSAPRYLPPSPSRAVNRAAAGSDGWGRGDGEGGGRGGGAREAGAGHFTCGG
jgi:hypothetical protein